MMNIIEIKNLTKNYGKSRGIIDVSFNVKQGEVIGLLGPNGAGKTTIIRILMGFIKKDSGNSYIKKLDVFKDASVIQNDVGYIPGEINFISDMTGKDFIKFMADYQGLKDLSKANQLIDFFELDPSAKIQKFSKGMKQKLGIIIAFMHNPDILILDEPTSGLDPLMQNKFINLINMEKKKGKTILLSSHMFEEIEKTCDKVVIIKEGKVVTIDNIENMKKTQIKKYTIYLNNEKDIPKIKKENLNIINIDNKKVTVLIENNLNNFIQIISKYNIYDLDEEKQNLEDVFINFYKGDEDDK